MPERKSAGGHRSLRLLASRRRLSVRRLSVDFPRTLTSPAAAHMSRSGRWTVKTTSRCSPKRDGVIPDEPPRTCWGSGRSPGAGNDPRLIYAPLRPPHPAVAVAPTRGGGTFAFDVAIAVSVARCGRRPAHPRYSPSSR